MKTWNAGKLIAPAALMCAMFARIPAAQAAPLVLGYYTNWSVYAASYKPGNISSGVDEILYSFGEVGDCNVASPPTEINYTQPSSCKQQLSGTGVEIHSGTQDYKLHSTDPWSDFCVYLNQSGVNIGGLCDIGQTLATNKPVEYSIGGWTLSAPIRGAIQPANATGFINSIIALMKQAEADAAAKGLTTNRFNGVDVDWEPNGNMWTLPTTAPNEFVPLTTTDLANYQTFLTQLKTALAASGYPTLSIAMTANPAAIADVESKSPGYWKSLATAGVQLNLMTYDYNGQAFTGGCTTTEFNAPLYGDSANPCTFAKTFDSNDSVQALKTAGVPAASIGIGLAAYGRAYSIANFNDLTPTNPYVAFINAAQTVYNVAAPAYGDVWSYRELLTGRAYGANTTPENTTWIPVGQYATPVGNLPVQSFAKSYVNYKAPAFISYSGYSDAQNVMSYAATNGLASVMVWELDQDVQAGDANYTGQPINLSTSSVVAGLVSAKP